MFHGGVAFAGLSISDVTLYDKLLGQEDSEPKTTDKEDTPENKNQNVELTQESAPTIPKDPADFAKEYDISQENATKLLTNIEDSKKLFAASSAAMAYYIRSFSDIDKDDFRDEMAFKRYQQNGLKQLLNQTVMTFAGAGFGIGLGGFATNLLSPDSNIKLEEKYGLSIQNAYRLKKACAAEVLTVAGSSSLAVASLKHTGYAIEVALDNHALET